MDTTRVLEALNNAAGLEARFAALRGVLAPPPDLALFYGFGAPRCGADGHSGPRVTRVIFDNRLSDWWEAYSRDQSRRLQDPVRQAVRNSIAPVTWSHVAGKTCLRDCRDPIWEPVHALGITHAVSVPLHDPVAATYGTFTLIAFDRGSESRAWMQELANDLVAIAYLFHGGLGMSEASGSECGSRLSNRERECLELVACGLRSKQVARSLGLSSRTVDLHLARAMRRLGAATRTEAVVRAQGTDQFRPARQPAGEGGGLAALPGCSASFMRDPDAVGSQLPSDER